MPKVKGYKKNTTKRRVASLKKKKAGVLSRGIKRKK